MGIRVGRPQKEKATYLVPGTLDKSKILSIVCGDILLEFSIPKNDTGLFTVSDITDDAKLSKEYKVDASSFVSNYGDLYAAMISISQKSLPIKQFKLEQVVKLNMYKKISSIQNLTRQSSSKFHLAYDRDGYTIGLVGTIRGRCIFVGFVLLERIARKFSSKYGNVLTRFGAGTHIQ